MKNKGIIALVLGALTVGVGAYFVYDKFKKKNSVTGFGDVDDTGVPFTNSSTNSNTNTNSGFPLKKGSEGNRVKALQRFLNTEQDAGLDVDGNFGPKTEKAWLENQVCDVVPTTLSNCWKNYKASYSGAIVGQVDEEFYNTHIRDFE